MSKNNYDELNIHQKLLKIADLAGVLTKNKAGYNYKYVTEDSIQAKITAGMQKYGVMLYPSIVKDSVEVMPYHYDKAKTKKMHNEKTNKDEIVDYTVPVNEVIVKAEVVYTWVNTDKPDEKIECGWAYIGQMEDASQAFGAGATYGNRYYLLKALQMATTEDDPDNYRTKQKEAEDYEETKKQKEIEKQLKELKDAIVNTGKELMANGTPKEKIAETVANLNEGNGNPNSIQSIEVATTILEELNKLKEKK